MIHNYMSSIPIEYKKFFKFKIEPIDGTLINTTTSVQSRPESNDNVRVLYTPQIWSINIRNSFVSYSGHPFLWGRGVLPFCREI